MNTPVFLPIGKKLQYSSGILYSSEDPGWALVHGVKKSWTQLSDWEYMYMWNQSIQLKQRSPIQKSPKARLVT